MVCGHPLGPLGRICDKCGSIRRPAKVVGLENPQERFSTCERCGEKVRYGRQYCPQCATYMKAHQKEHGKEEREIHPSFLTRLIEAIKRLFRRGESSDSGN